MAGYLGVFLLLVVLAGVLSAPLQLGAEEDSRDKREAEPHRGKFFGGFHHRRGKFGHGGGYAGGHAGAFAGAHGGGGSSNSFSQSYSHSFSSPFGSFSSSGSFAGSHAGGYR